MAKTEYKIKMLENKISAVNRQMSEAWSAGDEDLYDELESDLDKLKRKLENLIN